MKPIIQSAGEAVAATNLMAQLASLIRSGDTQGALSLVEAASGDTLINTILDHKAKWNQYISKDDDAERDYEPALEKLKSWNSPATSRLEAIEALRYAVEFYDVGDSPVIPAMMKAALGYLESSDDSNASAPNSGLDPLFRTIHAYRDGVKQMKAVPSVTITQENEDALVDATYGTPLQALLAWNQPASSREGAIEALRLMKDEDVFVDSIGESMRRAVLGYLEHNGPFQPEQKRSPDAGEDLSHLFYDLIDLHQLSEAIYDILWQMDYTKADGSRNTELDRVAALHRILRANVATLRDAAEVLDKLLKAGHRPEGQKLLARFWA